MMMPPGMPPPNFSVPPPGYQPPTSTGATSAADSTGTAALPTQNAAGDSSADLWVETKTPEGKV